jgi:hypothetical protein
MFKKLKNTFTFNDYETLVNQVRYGRVREDVFYGISYDIILIESNSKLFEVIPEQYRCKFSLVSMEINSHVRPHTDSNVLASINFYINTQRAITKFYTAKSNNRKIPNFGSQTNGAIFNLADLDEHSEFVAQDNEAFVLNVTNPHSVTCTRFGMRKALVLQTKEFSFDEVCNMLIETNNL